MAAGHVRRNGWLVTYAVEVVFDTDHARCRYDHVGTVARCSCCGERLDRSPEFGGVAAISGHFWWVTTL